MDVLSKGLSFVPTPEPTPMNEIYSAFYKFCRRLYLKFHFLNKPTEELPPFHLPSVWEPPVPDNNNIQRYTSHIYREISHLQQPSLPVNNLSSKEFEAIHDLQSNRDIIIKPADKGGKIVIWGRNEYLKEACRQLNDRDYYIPIGNSPIGGLIPEISSFMSFLCRRSHIDCPTFKFLGPGVGAGAPLFCLLPGMHGPGVPGGPIVSGCSSPTADLSTYMGYYIKPIVGRVPSCIRGTTHFLRALGSFVGGVQQNSILVAFDVQSLCTNIPHDEGINYCSVALQEFYGNNLPLPLRCMTQFIEFILKKNYFQFRGNFSLQVRGAAVGSPFAPSCAGVMMGAIERRILS